MFNSGSGVKKKPDPLPRRRREKRGSENHSASNEKKLLWTVAVILLPLLGLILWFFLGPRGSKT